MGKPKKVKAPVTETQPVVTQESASAPDAAIDSGSVAAQVGLAETPDAKPDSPLAPPVEPTAPVGETVTKVSPGIGITKEKAEPVAKEQSTVVQKLLAIAKFMKNKKTDVLHKDFKIDKIHVGLLVEWIEKEARGKLHLSDGNKSVIDAVHAKLAKKNLV